MPGGLESRVQVGCHQGPVAGPVRLFTPTSWLLLQRQGRVPTLCRCPRGKPSHSPHPSSRHHVPTLEPVAAGKDHPGEGLRPPQRPPETEAGETRPQQMNPKRWRMPGPGQPVEAELPESPGRAVPTPRLGLEADVDLGLQNRRGTCGPLGAQLVTPARPLCCVRGHGGPGTWGALPCLLQPETGVGPGSGPGGSVSLPTSLFLSLGLSTWKSGQFRACRGSKPGLARARRALYAEPRPQPEVAHRRQEDDCLFLQQVCGEIRGWFFSCN